MSKISKRISVLSAVGIVGVIFFAKFFALGIGQDFASFAIWGMTKRTAFLFGFLLVVLILIVMPPSYRRALLSSLNFAAAPSPKVQFDGQNLSAAVALIMSAVVVGFVVFAKYLETDVRNYLFFWLGPLFTISALSVFFSLAEYVKNRARLLGLRKSEDLRILRPRLTKLFQKRKANSKNCLTVLVVNFISFVALSFTAFKINDTYVLNGLDGSYMVELVREQMEWLPLQLGFSNNFLQSLGNVWFPLNSYLIPGYAISILNGGKVAPALSYTIFSSELFLATLSLGILLRVRPILAVTIGWTICLVSFPYRGFSKLYYVLGLVPQLSTLWATGIFMLIFYWLIGKKNAFISLLCLTAVFLLMVGDLLALSVATVEIAPVLGVFGLFGLIYSESQYERSWKLVASGAILAALLMSGCASFLYGLFKNTAVYFFPDEFVNDRMQLTFASVLFNSRDGFILFALCLIGVLIVGLRGSGPSRVFAKATLICMNLVLISGVICESFDIWHGPSPLYFEFLLWPIYAIFAAIALGILGLYSYEMVILLIGTTKAKKAINLIRSGSASFYGLAVAILPWWIILIPALHGQPQTERYYTYPPLETPAVTELARQISLKPGEIFRGRAGTFTGQGISGGIDWLALHAMDKELINRFGNDHRLVGLWYFDIPTLTEYSPLITPAFYLITKYFLARSGDVQMRSAITLRDINPKILKMLGVRFLITDAPIAGFVHLRERIPEFGQPRLFLYELGGVNVGQFSPHKSILGSSASDMLTAMAVPEFDPEKDIVVEDSLPENLARLANSRLIAEVEGLRIFASSSGTSVILLPLEYSHCLEVRPIGPEQSPAKLFRANLILTGVLFDRKLDAVVSYFTGPFRNAGCRLKDARDMQRLNVTAALSSNL